MFRIFKDIKTSHNFILSVRPHEFQWSTSIFFRYENESKQLREDLKFRDRQIGRLQSEIKDLKKTRQDHENLTWKTDVNVQNEKQMKLESERQQKYIQHLEDELKLSKYDRIEGEVTEREKLETAKRELCDKSLEVADLKTR